MKILLFLLTSLLPWQLLAQTVEPEIEIPSLIKQAEAYADAYERADAEAYLGMTHSSIQRFNIPRSQLLLMLQRAMEQPKALGIVLERREIAKPSACYKAFQEVVCFLPRRMTIRTNGDREVMRGYLLAVRQANGNQDWKFLDSDGFRKQRSRLWELFPALPADIEIPPIATESAP